MIFRIGSTPGEDLSLAASHDRKCSLLCSESSARDRRIDVMNAAAGEKLGMLLCLGRLDGAHVDHDAARL